MLELEFQPPRVHPAGRASVASSIEPLVLDCAGVVAAAVARRQNWDLALPIPHFAIAAVGFEVVHLERSVDQLYKRDRSVLDAAKHCNSFCGEYGHSLFPR